MQPTKVTRWGDLSTTADETHSSTTSDQVPHTTLFAVADLTADQQVLFYCGLRKLSFEDEIGTTMCSVLHY